MKLTLQWRSDRVHLPSDPPLSLSVMYLNEFRTTLYHSLCKSDKGQGNVSRMFVRTNQDQQGGKMEIAGRAMTATTVDWNTASACGAYFELGTMGAGNSRMQRL